MATGVKAVEAAQREEGTPEGGAGTAYKPNQGVGTRRIAFWAGVFFSVWAAFDLWKGLQGFDTLARPLFTAVTHVPLLKVRLGGALLIAAAVAAGGVWLTHRLLARPRLADLLIDTESELKKVSWPAWDEAWVATKVVSLTVLLFTLVLLLWDYGITLVLRLFTGLEL